MKTKLEAQNPLILRAQRLIEAFAKSDDEKDFYINRQEGFLIYVDLDKPDQELKELEKELTLHKDLYCPIPKLSFYEVKKIMETFAHDKVYDIDTKERLLDIIQSKEARESFIEFLFDHHHEQEKWQQFYQERSRVRIIEWLRANHFYFVFEEDLELPRSTLEKLKQSLFQAKVGKELQDARKVLVLKAKSYYSNDALHPKPKRGRPPKQVAKPEIAPSMSLDIYTTVPLPLTPFLFKGPIRSGLPFMAFSSKLDDDEEWLKAHQYVDESEEESLNKKLASLRALSGDWGTSSKENDAFGFDDDEDDEDWDDEDDDLTPKKKTTAKSKKETSSSKKESPKKGAKPAVKKAAAPTKTEKPEKKNIKSKGKRIMPRKPKVK